MIDQPKEAFMYFKKVSKSFQNKVMYWIRMAECCIKYNMINKEEEDYRGGCNPVIQTIVSKGRSRRLIVRCNSTYLETDDHKDGGDTDTVSDLTLKRSIDYLHKALEIIDKSNNEKQGPDNYIEEPTWAIEKDFTISSPLKVNSINGKLKESHRLRYSVLTKLAYVQLCLSDPKQALDTCMLVLNSSSANGELKFVSRMYCIEALCLLGHPDEAIKKLEEDLKDEGLLQGQIPPSWTFRPLPLSADVLTRLIFQVNYAAALALKGELDGAQKILEIIVEKVPTFVPAFRGLIYVYLRKGNHKSAAKLFDFHRWI
jgi:tetratricopeptide (TPR) repeat protein